VKKEKLVALNVRVPQNLKALMRNYVALDAHKDLSELARDAIREKIKRDAPQLFAQLFQTPEAAP
jgi:Arc/MetJ-type ribon-helix-helix transcriptional regulator